MATAIASHEHGRTATYIHKTNVYDLDLNDFSLCCWFNTDSVADAYTGLISQIDGGSPFLALHVNVVAFFTQQWRDTTTILSTGNWYCCAVTHEESTNNIKIYVGTQAANLTLEYDDNFEMFEAGDDIGMTVYRYGDIATLDGKFAFGRVYDNVLTLGQLKEVLANPEADYGGNLIYWLKLNSDVSEDFSGEGNTATVTGTFGTSTSGPPVANLLAACNQ